MTKDKNLMTTGKQDNDSIVDQLIGWLNKHAESKQSDLESDTLENSALKESDEQKDTENITLEQSVSILSQSIIKCAGEVTKIALSLSSTIKAVNDHSTMIEDLYATQAAILKLLQTGAMSASASITRDTNIIDDKNKKKTEKPN